MPRFGPALALAIAAACLSGCGEGPGPGHGAHHGGRYLGVGIYPAGDLWSRLAGIPRRPAEGAATLEDDSQIIVVVDSQTGEVRQCGNLSGHCIRMSPWTAGPPAAARLTAHAADLAREADQEQAEMANRAQAAGRR